jgi:hypothetical protein
MKREGKSYYRVIYEGINKDTKYAVGQKDKVVFKDLYFR